MAHRLMQWQMALTRLVMIAVQHRQVDLQLSAIVLASCPDGELRPHCPSDE
jgi:hypothetical protein